MSRDARKQSRREFLENTDSEDSNEDNDSFCDDSSSKESVIKSGMLVTHNSSHSTDTSEDASDCDDISDEGKLKLYMFLPEDLETELI